MLYVSTKGESPPTTFREAVLQGLPKDNGLYLPETIPQLPQAFFDHLPRMTLAEIGFEVSRAIIGDEIPSEDLRELVVKAINFPAPLHTLSEDKVMLELFHGPTLAFKDFGARFMAQVMGYFVRGSNQHLTVLVATSGDTGSAVAHGFLGVTGIDVVILYPKGKVSPLQEKQLTTMGQNITALEVEGAFDDCQRLVKAAFLDKELQQQRNLTSANSINLARLVPQSFYYFYAWGQLQELGRPIVFSVPSGNFGNLTGGLLAKKMGLPVHRFIAATNANNVVPEYLQTGTYTPRASIATCSNAMDVGAPSNFARIDSLFSGDYAVLSQELWGQGFSDQETVAMIQRIYEELGYLLDPHAAVGVLGAEAYQKTHKEEKALAVVLATAHPAKFLEVVEQATGEEVRLPPALERVRDLPKQAETITANFQELKNYLLGRVVV